ncbi:MAG TPA: M28 family peptidase [Bacteroidales bacterium]|nr:M28 family peptidase [Bacteroidales bacterium]
MNKTIPFLLLAFLFLAACNQPAKHEETKQEATPSGPRVPVPDFNGDSALEFARLQLAFGPRVPNTPAHEKCATWLTSKMESWTPHLTVQKGQVYAYNKTALNFRNIIGSWNPENTTRVLLCAHWDSRPFADHDPNPANHRKPVDAANDGASGVGVLMEMARQFSLKPPPIGVDIILLDVEDYGPPQDENISQSEDFWGQGAQYWAKNPHVKNYTARYGILLDMVGAPNATFLMEKVSMDYASDILKLVWSAAGRVGYSSYFLYQEGGYITDDHVPINKIRNIPTIDIIHLDRNSETGFYPYWHTTGDTFDKLDKNTLKAVGQTLLTVVFEEK